MHLLWYCPNMNVSWLHWWSVIIGSGNGLVPSGNKPLPESILPRSLTPYGVTRPQRVKLASLEYTPFIETHQLTSIRQIRREQFQGQASDTNTLFKDVHDNDVINCISKAALKSNRASNTDFFSPRAHTMLFCTQIKAVSTLWFYSFIPKAPLNNESALIEVMACQRTATQPLSGPMMTLTHTDSMCH